MKISKASLIFSLVAFTLLFFSCEDLTEVNKNPNSPEEVSSNYILTYVLTHSAKAYYSLGAERTPVAGAMQYNQMGTNEDAILINQYGWSRGSWTEYYSILRNNQIIYDNSERDRNNFCKAISLTMRAFVYGLTTDLFGDIPYSEALNAKDGVYFPKYDSQPDIYKGIMQDLSQANDLLGSLRPTDAISPAADVFYGGDPSKWRKFVNALRLRYCMRLSDKLPEMNAAGLNLAEEFKSASGNTFTSNTDDAVLNFIGTSADNSTPGGPLNSSNPRYQVKPSKPLVNKLLSLKDPRLHRWVLPVLNKWDKTITVTKDVSVKNAFGESFTVKLMPAAVTAVVDTALYVGMPVGLSVADATSYNKGTDAVTYNPERSPYVSFLHNRYRLNTDPYVKINLATYSEVEFILAEAALTGRFVVSGTAEEHYTKGIKASMDQYGALSASGFSFDQYMAQPLVSYNQANVKLERIMEQKWISSWLNVQSWFDWRRTGYPDLKTGPVAQFGNAIPVRFMYPSPNADIKYLVNYNAAVELLENTPYIPSGQSKDHHYAKMWLLKGTSKPW
jgi:hypothetical protein